MPKSSFATLIIYDLLGRELSVLINENLPAGSYIVKLDAKSLSSGVYFYRIEAEGFIQTKRMVVIK